MEFQDTTPDLLKTIYANDADLLAQVRGFIERGADLNHVTRYGESALRVASNNGRFDVVEALLLAGADSAQLRWNRTFYETAVGTADSLDAALRELDGSELETTDFWSRTPFLLAVQTGDIDKSARLLDRGANRDATGRCGKIVLQYAVESGRLEMVGWLLDRCFDIEATDDFATTPLMTAAAMGQAECVRLLLDRGADIARENHVQERAIRMASTMAVVRVLLAYGEDLSDISPEMRAELLGVAHDGAPETTLQAYLEGRLRRFGRHNGEETNDPFWLAMIRSGATGYRASQLFAQAAPPEAPVWCYQRFGRTTTELGDGRIVEVAGEHEDSYDPDFCIYNDVTVFDGQGGIRVFSYPEDVFPPTDFHTATLVGKHIYLIGSLGYYGRREVGTTPVFRLDTVSMRIEKVATSGEAPGWISRHQARLTADGRIVASGGMRIVDAGGKEDYVANDAVYVLCLASGTWRRLEEDALRA